MKTVVWIIWTYGCLIPLDDPPDCKWTPQLSYQYESKEKCELFRARKSFDSWIDKTECREKVLIQ